MNKSMKELLITYHHAKQIKCPESRLEFMLSAINEMKAYLKKHDIPNKNVYRSIVKKREDDYYQIKWDIMQELLTDFESSFDD